VSGALVPSLSPQPDQELRRRRIGVIVSAVVVFLLLLVVLSQNAFNLKFLQPETSQQTLLLVALSALIFLLLVALSFVLVRNVAKVYAERRLGMLGARFRTRMVLGALALSLTPVIFLFLFAFGLMNRSIERWFSRPVEELREDSDRVAALLTSYARDNAKAEADGIALAPQTQFAFRTGNYAGIDDVLRQHQPSLQGGFAIAVLDDFAIASVHAPEPWATLRSKLPPEAIGQPAPATDSSIPKGPGKLLAGEHYQPFHMNGSDFALGVSSVAPNGRIIVAVPLPADFSPTLAHIEESQRKYYELAQQRKAVRRTYIGYLLLITVIVLFAATWLALFVSKLATRPVTALAAATQEISRGHLNYRVDMTAADEFGELVTSFNQMAAELEASRTRIEDSSRELAGANTALDQRRRYMETILESIPTGVLSLDAARRVTRTNDALLRMFTPRYSGPGSTQPLPCFSEGSTLTELFSAEVAQDLELMTRKADRMGMVAAQMEIVTKGAKFTVAVTVASLSHQRQRLGYVIVFEDLSDLLRAQKQSAWREVARRVAHEIKNPLTPIALSAERILRHLERGQSPDEESLQVISSCATTIGDAVETVRTLVDEFSAMARFPTSQPQPADANSIVDGALTMFEGRLDGIRLERHLAADLPPIMADPEAMKRVVANLVDNAADAMQDALVREIHVSTALVENRDAVEIVVTDTGHGVTPDQKEKLFLPYFSTKKRGTGLGLAIVSRILEEHHGAIRVEDNYPVGARFVVELPVAPRSNEQPASQEAHA
jgi:two-component system, NtrC family, nitrogen regulation sensor histidine kinase NtrY